MCHNETPIFRDIHSRYGGSILEFIYASPTNVLKYYLYKSTKAVEFYRPIMYLFFLAQGAHFYADRYSRGDIQSDDASR